MAVLLTLVTTIPLLMLVLFFGYTRPILLLEQKLVEEGWINREDFKTGLISNIFIYDRCKQYKSEKSNFDVMIGVLADRSAKRFYLAFQFSSTMPNASVTNSPIFPPLGKQKGIKNPNSVFTWSSDIQAVDLIPAGVDPSENAPEISVVIENGVGLIIFTFKRVSERMNITDFINIANEIRIHCK